ncbi:MAG: hypothetical protein V9E94_04790 [Microthrixaceae bacterium]
MLLADVERLVGGVEGRVRDCLASRLLVEPLAIGAVSEPVAAAVVDDCSRVVQVVDAWAGDVDRDCLFELFSASSSEQLEKYYAALVNPAARDDDTSEFVDAVARCG